MSKKVIIQCEDVYKAYPLGKQSVEVLRGVSIRGNRGEALSIMGASGTGKSTLLHILGMLDEPDQGTLLIEGEDVFKKPAAYRTRLRAKIIGFVFQQYHLLPELNVVENVLLPHLALHPMGRGKAAEDKAKDLLKVVGLDHRLKHLPLELSGGEQQRVALARALINDPQIVLADEPTGNLDSKMGEKVLDCLFELTHMTGNTLILVTHNETVAKRCDREIVMEDGRIAD